MKAFPYKVFSSLTEARPPKVKAQGCKAASLSCSNHSFHDVVVHASTVEGMRMKRKEGTSAMRGFIGHTALKHSSKTRKLYLSFSQLLKSHINSILLVG